MALFFKTEPSVPVQNVIAEALTTPPPSSGDRGQLAAQLLAKAQPGFTNTLIAALGQPPPSPDRLDSVTHQLANGIPPNEVKTEIQKIAWERLILAAIFLGMIFGLAIYTSHDDKMHDFTKPLLGTFTTLLGAVAGLITGEATGKK